MKCQTESSILLSAYTISGTVLVPCNHKFCQSCFRRKNAGLALSLIYIFTCPCCHFALFNNMVSIDEAILLGEAATMRTLITPKLFLPATTEIDAASRISIDAINNLVVEKMVQALVLNH